MSQHQPISPKEAATELLRRRRARESLIDYALAIEIPGAPVSEDPDEWMFHPIETAMAAHHRLFLREIQSCIEKPYGRLMILAPPGSAKSTYTSVVAPTWAMGKIPGFKVVNTSYAQQPAFRSAKRCQQIVRSAEYQSIWEMPTSTSDVRRVTPVKGESGIEEWTLSNGSTMLSAGLLGGITSSRADLGIIDDPVAGREEAESPQIRRKTRAAYDDDFLTRLKPKASIILMNTRWQEEDLSGSILPEEWDGESGDILCRDGQVWRVICLPAEADRHDDPLGRKIGEMLWPEWFDERHWAIYRKNLRTWTALYQQKPAPDSGGLFAKEDFKRYSKTPEGLTYILSSDYAVTEEDIVKKERPAKTAHVIAGIDHMGELYLDACENHAEDIDKSIERAIHLILRYKPISQLIERGTILNATKGAINREMRDSKTKYGKNAFAAIEPMDSSQDKVAKAATFRARAKMGMVWVKNGSEGDELIAALCGFPWGYYKDIPDACGQIGRYIDEVYTQKPGKADTREQIARRGNVKPMTDQMLEAIVRDEEEEARRRREFMG